MLIDKLATLTGAAVVALFLAAPASALTMAECSTKYQAAKDAGTLDGQTWNQFRKGECGSDASAAETSKPAKKTKKAAGGPSSNPIVFVINYLKQVVAELRKVIWPNRKQMVSYTSVVLVFLVFMVALISGVDLGLARLVSLVFGT